MRNVTIVESNVEPNKEHLWFYNGKLKWFGPNGWEEINPQVLSPTTTPKPVVITTTTSTPVPITTTTTTSTGPSTFKLINNTGNTITIYAMGWIEGEINTVYPTILDGASVLVLKGNEYVDLYSSHKLGMMVDGRDRGELPLTGPNNCRIYQSIFSEATEISIYNTGVLITTSTTKPNVK